MKVKLNFDPNYGFARKDKFVYADGKLYKSDLTDKEQEMLSYELMSDDSADSIIPFECCRKAFLEGAFLGGGSVNDPNSGYHLEFTAKTKLREIGAFSYAYLCA